MSARSTLEERWDELRALELFAELTDEGAELLQFEVLRASDAADPSVAPPRNRTSYVEFGSVAAGDAVQLQGDLATRVGVVLEGELHAIRAERLTGERRVGTYAKGDCFGEVTALSLLPSPVTVRAAAECRIAWLDERLFRMLLESEEDEPFQQRVDEAYRARYLLFHLRFTPLLAELDEAALAQLASECEFVTKPAGEAIAEQGAPISAFWLVRSGGLECERVEEDGRRRVLAYYMANSSLGEHAVVAAAAAWPGTLRTRARTELVAIPRARFEKLRALAPASHVALQRLANRVLMEDGADPAGALEEADVMVERQSWKGGRALVIDQLKCIRCNACVESCASVHRDGIARISKIGTRTSTKNVLITACYHCDVPSCMEKCKFGAIRRDARGSVRFVLENCVGCAECVSGCPYDVIRMTDLLHEQTARNEPPGFLRRWLGRWLGRGRSIGVGTRGGEREFGLPQVVTSFAGKDEPVGGKAIKCDLCAGLPFEACVYDCPTQAITRRAPESLFLTRSAS
jgi:Fe-S-cluster-containing dehydrogenase component/CRP-like cAMP-binding protein